MTQLLQDPGPLSWSKPVFPLPSADLFVRIGVQLHNGRRPKHQLPFPILGDDAHGTFDAYDVASRAVSLGQRPAVFVVDTEGIVRFDSVGTQQWQIPRNDEVLAVLEGLAGSRPTG